jgi:hypothetical protein
MANRNTIPGTLKEISKGNVGTLLTGVPISLYKKTFHESSKTDR